MFTFTGIIYARQSVAAIGASLRDLELLALVGEPAECANRLIYLPL
jgi:hypothetical protein